MLNGEGRMRTVIAGCRTVPETAEAVAALDGLIRERGLVVTEVVSGTCRGGDRVGEAWAEANSVSVSRFPAEWEKFGRAAGPVRNARMAEVAEQVILILDRPLEETRGSLSMSREAGKRGLRVYTLTLEAPCPSR